MIEKERHVLIMDQLRENGFVSVKDLMTRLETSRSSVMRDLIALEGQGLLIREHGGAALPEVTQTLSRRGEPAVAEKVNEKVREKRIIAARAAMLVKPGFCIFLDSGTTTPNVLNAIRDKEVTVVTPSVYLVKHLPEGMAGSVYLLGGQYDAKYDMNRGEYASGMLEMFHIDLGFFSANGIRLENGDVMVADFNLAAAKKQAMKQCARKVLLVDDSKVNRMASCTYAKLEEFEAVYINGKKQDDDPDNIVKVEEKQK